MKEEVEDNELGSRRQMRMGGMNGRRNLEGRNLEGRNLEEMGGGQEEDEDVNRMLHGHMHGDDDGDVDDDDAMDGHNINDEEEGDEENEENQENQTVRRRRHDGGHHNDVDEDHDEDDVNDENEEEDEEDDVNDRYGSEYSGQSHYSRMYGLVREDSLELARRRHRSAAGGGDALEPSTAVLADKWGEVQVRDWLYRIGIPDAIDRFESLGITGKCLSGLARLGKNGGGAAVMMEIVRGEMGIRNLGPFLNFVDELHKIILVVLRSAYDGLTYFYLLTRILM
eukprot:CAMPEP_0175070200 /NCGR_PEP_ID=MMETSP0052_2-20121109/18590_1 /TAXON_ID=51329 ORGANISM="Polytomella parva, Strain SAG 63-3" /NCGR_SAMPLE_ID=MMETSP0052_2 /ASSEMBLY_ACC=CAM_ASM_000194 /LENGTH=281 /DNA_ID=CAMNT_0016337303 /DNA_START=32 /DNA_END=877 /DNA_ORIENTATION=+